jgi:hypothetical protein
MEVPGEVRIARGSSATISRRGAVAEAEIGLCTHGSVDERDGLLRHQLVGNRRRRRCAAVAAPFGAQHPMVRAQFAGEEVPVVRCLEPAVQHDDR